MAIAGNNETNQIKIHLQPIVLLEEVLGRGTGRFVGSIGQFHALLLEDLKLATQHQSSLVVVIALLAQCLLLLLHLLGHG